MNDIDHRPAGTHLPVRFANTLLLVLLALVPAMAADLPSRDQVVRLADLFWFVPGSGYFQALGTRHALEECVALGATFVTALILLATLLATGQVSATLLRIRARGGLRWRDRGLLIAFFLLVAFAWRQPAALLHDDAVSVSWSLTHLIETNVVVRGLCCVALALLTFFGAFSLIAAFSSAPRKA